jgi:hypothetical protein
MLILPVLYETKIVEGDLVSSTSKDVELAYICSLYVQLCTAYTKTSEHPPHSRITSADKPREEIF